MSLYEEGLVSLAMSSEQRIVIEAAASERMLVFAGPGAGKTQVSAERLRQLLSLGLRPSSLLVLSFSRSAVATLTRRLTGLHGDDQATLEELRHVAIRTFDSWTFRVLRQLGFDSEELLRRSHDENVNELVLLMRSDRREEVRNFLGKIRHVLVDEMQDLAGVRGDLVIELLDLIAPCGSAAVGFTLLGDQAQSIYGFSVRLSGRKSMHGDTTAELLASLQSKWAHELREASLNRNYRATPEIAEILESLRLTLRQQTESEVKLGKVAEVLGALPTAGLELGQDALTQSRLQSVGILARTNGEVLRISQKILGQDVAGPGTPFHIGGADDIAAPSWVAALLGCVRATTITRPQFDAIVARARSEAPEALAALSFPETAVAWRRLLAAAGAPVHSASFVLRDLTRRMNWTDAFPDDQSIPDAGLFISTIHQAKGREFDVVAILDHASKEPDGRDADPEEEACVGFVALSRAAKRLVRIPADAIYLPPAPRQFANGARSRLCYWRNGWVNLEMGIRGDVDPASFADVELLGGDEAVVDNYRFLAANAGALIGHKVMLRKAALPGSSGQKVRYEICLQVGRQPGRIVGATSQNLVWDLLSVLHKHGHKLPGTIMNLRISRVVSVSARGTDEDKASRIFASSGMWLGVGLVGTGDFPIYKRKS